MAFLQRRASTQLATVQLQLQERFQHKQPENQEQHGEQHHEQHQEHQEHQHQHQQHPHLQLALASLQFGSGDAPHRGSPADTLPAVNRPQRGLCHPSVVFDGAPPTTQLLRSGSPFVPYTALQLSPRCVLPALQKPGAHAVHAAPRRGLLRPEAHGAHSPALSRQSVPGGQCEALTNVAGGAGAAAADGAGAGAGAGAVALAIVAFVALAETFVAVPVMFVLFMVLRSSQAPVEPPPSHRKLFLPDDDNSKAGLACSVLILTRYCNSATPELFR